MFRCIGRALSLVILYSLFFLLLPILLVLAFLPELEVRVRRWRPAAASIAVACLAIVLFPVLAFADAPVLQPSGVVAQTAVDFSPVLTSVIQVAAAIISIIGVPIAVSVWNWFRQKQGLATVELTEAQRAEADAVWRKVVGFGVQKTDGLTAAMAASGDLAPNVKSDFVRNALSYGIQHFPDVLKRARVLDSQGNPDVAQLERILDARLGMLAISQATAPQTLASATAATPPVAPAT